MSKKIVICVAAAILLVAGVSTYYISGYCRNIRKTTLVTAFDELPETLNPVFEQNPTGLILLDTIFDGLTNKSGKKPNDYHMAIATEFVQDDEEKTVFYIEIDTGIRWHDYSDENRHYVTATDIIFTYNCIINESNRSPLYGRINKLVENIEEVADDEIKITFREAVSPNKISWLLPFKIIPAKYYGEAMSTNLRTDAVARKFAKKPIGTGPFKLEKWQGNKIVLSIMNLDDQEEIQLPGYTDDLEKTANLSRIETSLIHDLDKQAKMLIDGKVDLLLKSNSDLNEKLNAHDLKHEEYIPRHFYAIAYNTRSKEFKNMVVRQAMSMAINKIALAELVWPGDVRNYINNGTFPHNDDKRYRKLKNLLPYKIESAKKLLESYGEINATLIYPESESTTMKRLAGKISQMVSEVGINLNVKAIGMAFETQLAQGNYDAALVKHDNFTDGYNISQLYRSHSPENITGLNSSELDELLAAWENTAFWEKRLPLAIDIHNLVSELCPYTFLFSLPTSAYYSPRLTNVTISDPTALMASVREWRVKE